MARLYLVRHGEAGAAWTEDPDPALSMRGREQARDAADALVTIGARPIVTSPMRRARETADALASRWGVAPEVVPQIGEVPSPALVAVGDRGAWLREMMGSNWAEIGEGMREWRDAVAETLLSFPGDTFVFTHFMAINAAVAVAEGADRVVTFRPGYCSVTLLEHDGRDLRVLERGAEASTVVL